MPQPLCLACPAAPRLTQRRMPLLHLGRIMVGRKRLGQAAPDTGSYRHLTSKSIPDRPVDGGPQGPRCRRPAAQPGRCKYTKKSPAALHLQVQVHDEEPRSSTPAGRGSRRQQRTIGRCKYTRKSPAALSRQVPVHGEVARRVWPPPGWQHELPTVLSYPRASGPPKMMPNVTGSSVTDCRSATRASMLREWAACSPSLCPFRR
jgi:hypothetical protein